MVTGCSVWTHAYDQTVHNELDLPLLASLQTVLWVQFYPVVDLGGSTGRIGTGLWGQGITQSHITDCAPTMIHLAAATQGYTQLCLADITRLLGDYVRQDRRVNWPLLKMQERLVDDTYMAHRLGVALYRHQPVVFVMVWQA